MAQWKRLGEIKSNAVHHFVRHLCLGCIFAFSHPDQKEGQKMDLNKSYDNPTAEQDQHFMRKAIDQAMIAEENGDVPIGCVIVHKGIIIAKGYNQREQLCDPTAHAEIIALTQAAAALGSWRLGGCTIYVTLEPCPMCAGALVLSRLDRLVYGCDDPKTGAVTSLYNIVNDPRLNHAIETTSGVLEQDCSSVLSDFFLKKRTQNKESIN